ncbi:intermembrane lipid transfer protein VPS13A-like isoform X3 [Oratosquilla oratoria]|uniref:intermembrane lipid transfer protein VPS13A-like isoform X3 n=1 Tax=Oratosquilla oratoria TaxID=337810 RepID=UPI003F766397
MEWVAKKIVAGLVNRWFSQYVEDVNTQEVNDALLAGQVNLTNLRIRKDAFSFLDYYYGSPLPVEVKRGIIGRVSLTIPYSSFFTQPVIVNIEDIFILVTPVAEYDEEREKELERSQKKQALSRIFPEVVPDSDNAGNTSFWGLLYNRIWNNLELHIDNVHIRYEDTVSCSQPLVIGFCLQSLSAETTNHKWKKTQIEGNASTVNKVVDFVSASFYMNPGSDRQRLVKPHINSELWHQYLQQGLQAFSINDEHFNFVMQPVRCKVKMRQQVMREARVPGLLVDAVIKDAAISLSHSQYLALLQLNTSFTAINLNRHFMKFRPEVPLRRHSAVWWQYAAKAIILTRIKPYSWESIKAHRDIYHKYIALYKQHLKESHCGELEADLLHLEDKLSLTSIVLARVHTKILLSKEDPSLVQGVSASNSWMWWLWGSWGRGDIDEGGGSVDVCVNHNANGIITLNEEEKKELMKALRGFETSVDAEKHKDDIDQKLYLSLQNVTIILKDEFHDIAMASLSGFVMSAENRSGVQYQKVSAKAESLSMEASNIEQELVIVFKLVENTNNAGCGVAFSCDFEKNPLSVSADHGFTMRLNPIELMYNQYAMLEIIHFFKVPKTSKTWELTQIAKDALETTVDIGKAAVEYAIARHKIVHLDIDIKSPYIVIPEHGSLQKGGNVMVVDMGGLKVNSEIGGHVPDLDSATRMELEERLYDRLTIEVSQVQVLFADSGDEWRNFRKIEDSDIHLIPRVRVRVSLANSIHPEFRLQPKHKMDIHITPLKLNISDSRLTHLIEFAHHLPLPFGAADLHPLNDSVDSARDARAPQLFVIDSMDCLIDPGTTELLHLKESLLKRLKPKEMYPDGIDSHPTPPLLKHVHPLSSLDTISQTSLELEKYFSASDDSEDEAETWRKPVDLPGFEDNTSPSNMIVILTRFCIDEITISVARSSEHGERPYLMIRATRLVLETAIMDYGPAIQLTLGSLQLVDKYHHSSTGQYLELISSPHQDTVVTVLYRKVRANCPDFRTHFHSCEQSLIIDFASLDVVWHRGSVITLINFLTLMGAKFGHIDKTLPKIGLPVVMLAWIQAGQEDPPVPSGATKWSIATHLNTFHLRLCDNDTTDFLQAKMRGLQGECIFKANEKKIMRFSLSQLLVDDLSDITLHSHIIEFDDDDDDRVFDIKFVHFSPSPKDIVQESDNTSNALKPDASLRVRVGRIRCILLCKFIADFQRFVEPLINREGTHMAFKSMEKTAETGIEELISGRKVSLSIDIHAPTVLVPQKSDSASLLVFNLGDLKVDNLFKQQPGGGCGIIENVLVELGPLQVRRAVLTLSGELESQEAILEPLLLNADIKRSLMPKCRDLLSWDASVHVRMVNVHLGQKDLNTVLSVLTQNKAEAQFLDLNPHSRPLTPMETATPTTVNGDDNVGKLQAFLTHSIDIYHIANCYISLEGMNVTLFMDMDEVLSSPVRDATSALCRLEIGEVEVRGDMNSDLSKDVRVTLHSCDLYDVRVDSHHSVKKVFGQYNSKTQIKHVNFRFSVPPMMDIMYKVSPNGDGAVEISVERTRLNVSLAFCLAMYKYINDAIPSSSCTSGGIVNPGFIGDISNTVDGVRHIRRAPSSAESTSGYLSTVTSNSDDQKVLSVSLRVKRPEIVFFADPEEPVSRVLVLRSEMCMEYSRHPGHESYHFSLCGCQTFATMYTPQNQNPYTVVQPFDAEFNWVLRGVEEGVKAEIKISHIHIHISPPIAHILIDIEEELNKTLRDPALSFKLNLPSEDMEELWSPKPLTASVSPVNPDDEVYMKPEYTAAKPQEKLLVQVSVLTVSLERQTLKLTSPVLFLKAAGNAEIYDWSKQVHVKSEVQLQVSCFNEEFSAWEPIIEPVTDPNGVQRPWEVLMRIAQHGSQPIGLKRRHTNMQMDSLDSSPHLPSNRMNRLSSNIEDSDSSTEEEVNVDNEMVVLRSHPPLRIKKSSTKKSHTDNSGLAAGLPMDSDSETEDSLVHKISHAFLHMFSSDIEKSDDDTSAESSGELEEASETEQESQVRRSVSTSSETEDFDKEHETPVFKSEGLVQDSVDAGEPIGVLDQDPEGIATCVFIDSRDPLEISLTPHTIESIYNLSVEYLYKPCQSQPITCGGGLANKEINVVNEIGPESKVTITAHHERDGTVYEELVTSAKYHEPNSAPSSPGSIRSISRGVSSSSDDASTELSNHEDVDETVDDFVSLIYPESDLSVSCAHCCMLPLFGDWDHLSLSSCHMKGQPQDSSSTEPCFEQFSPNPVTLYKDITRHRIHIEVPGFDPLCIFVGSRSRNRVFQLSPAKNDVRYHIIVSVELTYQAINIYVRSPLQIMNDLPLPVNVCYKKSVMEGLEQVPTLAISPVNPFEAHVPIITLQPDETYTVPLTVAYNSSLHFQPAAAEYSVSERGVWWKEAVSSSRPHILICKPKGDQEELPITSAVAIQKGVSVHGYRLENMAGLVPNYIICLAPPLDIHNHLPCTLILHHPALTQPITLDPGSHSTMYKMDLREKMVLSVQVSNYQGNNWTGNLEFHTDREEDHKTLILSHSDAKQKMEVALYFVRTAVASVYIYAPYWIVNKTGLPLQIRGSKSKTIHESQGHEEVLLFRYKRNYPHKLKLRVVESEWSKRWGCEAVGSCGVVICEDRTRKKKYRILAKVTQSVLSAVTPPSHHSGESSGAIHLTKIVILMPYFVVRNLTSRPLKFMQENDKMDLWYDIQSQQCMPFWPDSENMRMVVRHRDSQVVSQHFHFNSIHTTVLRMEKGRALSVEVDGVGSDEPVTITFNKYQAGDAPVKIENWCEDIFLRLHQRDSNQVTLLAPHQSVLYTWDDPTLPRELMWNTYNRKSEDFSAVMNKDDHGSELITVTSLKPLVGRTQSQSCVGNPKIRPKRPKYRQRARTTISSSTDDEDEDEEEEEDKAVRDQEKPLKFQNRNTRKDKLVIYWVSYRQGGQRILLFTQSDSLRAVMCKPTERASLELCLGLDRIGLSLMNSTPKEIAYFCISSAAAHWEMEMSGVWKTHPSLELAAWLEDQYLNNSQQRVNLRGSLKLRRLKKQNVMVDLERMRMIQPFSCRLRRTKRPGFWMHYRHSKHYVYFSSKIHRLQLDNQLPEAVFPTVFYPCTENSKMQPCAQIYFVLHNAPNHITTVTHMSVVAQEFYLKLDKGFLLSMYELGKPFISMWNNGNIHTELKTLLTPLTYSLVQDSSEIDDGLVVEKACISPFKIHFSFSTRGLTGSVEADSDILEWFLTSIGASLTEMKNVTICIGHYEREAVLWNKMWVEYSHHATSQMLQQVYVLILGLDVLGNPYQRLRDLSQGVKDLLYQPALGIVEGPDEFAEGIAIGAQSLMGHIIGGTAESLNLIISSIGNTVAALSFDHDYRKRRRKRLEKQSSLQETMANASKTFVLGIALGLSGVVVKPVAGAQQDGIQGFFRGIGRGTMGLITKPALGVIDGVSMTFDAIARVIDQGHDVVCRARVPRHTSHFFPLQPYKSDEAKGVTILLSFNHRRYVQTDIYVAHAPLDSSDRPDVVLITDKHIFMLERCGMWGSWDVGWQVALQNLAKQPSLSQDAITLVLRQDEGQSHLSGVERRIGSNDQSILVFIMRYIEVLMTLQMEDQPCPRR